MHPLVAWILELTGSASSSSKAYNFWSGFGSDIGEVVIIGSLVAMVRKHNCGARWCWRIGHHNFTDPSTGLTHVLCRRHHPDHPGRPIRPEHILRIHHLKQHQKGGQDVH